MTQLSKHFSLEEMIKSGTAARLNLDNTPNKEQIENLKALCENILEPLREYYESRPIMVSSGFRSEKLSEAIGSSSRSQHCKGEAVDFEIPGFDNKQVAKVGIQITYTIPLIDEAIRSMEVMLYVGG